MTDYSELDRLIVEALAAGRSPYVGPTWREAHRIGPREVFDLVIRRIDALHAAGKIRRQKSGPSTGPARWVVVDGGSEVDVDDINVVDRLRWVAAEGGSERAE